MTSFLTVGIKTRIICEGDTLAEALVEGITQSEAGYLAEGDIIVVAEKVEERAQYEVCKTIGFHLVQGFYFARTQTFTAKVINPAFAAVLDLLNMISRDADIRDIENGFKRDAALSFKIV